MLALCPKGRQQEKRVVVAPNKCSAAAVLAIGRSRNCCGSFVELKAATSGHASVAAPFMVFIKALQTLRAACPTIVEFWLRIARRVLTRCVAFVSKRMHGHTTRRGGECTGGL